MVNSALVFDLDRPKRFHHFRYPVQDCGHNRVPQFFTVQEGWCTRGGISEDKLDELLRAGWRLRITPIPAAPGFYSAQAQLMWMRHRDDLEPTIDGDGANFPICYLLSFWAFESEFEIAARLFHRRVFPIPRDGLPRAA